MLGAFGLLKPWVPAHPLACISHENCISASKYNHDFNLSTWSTDKSGAAEYVWRGVGVGVCVLKGCVAVLECPCLNCGAFFLSKQYIHTNLYLPYR